MEYSNAPVPSLEPRNESIPQSIQDTLGNIPPSISKGVHYYNRHCVTISIVPTLCFKTCGHYKSSLQHDPIEIICAPKQSNNEYKFHSNVRTCTYSFLRTVHTLNPQEPCAWRSDRPCSVLRGGGGGGINKPHKPTSVITVSARGYYPPL